MHTDGATALLLSHETAQVIERINTFYGWNAVGRIKILQKPVQMKPAAPERRLRDLTRSEQDRLEQNLEGVQNERLRDALKKLGAQVIARNGDKAA